MGDLRKRHSRGGATGLAVLNSLAGHSCQSCSEHVSGAERPNFPLIVQLYLRDSRSITAPFPLRRPPAHAPLDFFNPAHRSFDFFYPLRSRSAARPDLRTGPQIVPPTGAIPLHPPIF